MIFRVLLLSSIFMLCALGQGRGEAKKKNKNKDQYAMSAVEKEYAYQAAQAVILGQTLAKQIKKKSKCLVIHHQIIEDDYSNVNRIVAGLKKGLGDKVTEFKKAPIRELDEKELKNLAVETLIEMTAENFNKVVRAHKDCDVVVTLVPMPFSEDEIYAMDIFKMIEDPNKPGFWIKDPKIKYPIFGVFNGYIGNLEPLFLEKLIHALTLWRPNPTIDEKPVPRDAQKAFDKRYITITPENIDSVKQQYPKLFPKPRK